MDTPPMLRGNNYPTHLSARCPAFDECKLCHACTKYNPHDLVCTICESRKSLDLICVHTDAEQYKMVWLERFFGKPFAHPDDKQQEVSIPVAENKEWEQIADGLDPTGLGRISQIK